MYIPSQATDIIKRFEGCRLSVYNDIGGKPTIGIGHLIQPGESLYTISMDEAKQLLNNDLQITVRTLSRGKMIKVKLNDNQYSAILSLTYNIGCGNFQRSTLRLKLNRGAYNEAADQFLRWSKVGGIFVQGLYNRRVAEKKLFLS